VLMSLMGHDLWVSEGFPLAMARKLRDLVSAVQGTGPMKMAAAPVERELTLGSLGSLARLGIIRPDTLKRYTYR